MLKVMLVRDLLGLGLRGDLFPYTHMHARQGCQAWSVMRVGGIRVRVRVRVRYVQFSRTEVSGNRTRERSDSG